MRPGEQNQKRPLNGSSGKPLTKKARIARPVIAGTKASQARAEAIRSGLANATSSSSIVPSSKPAAKRFKKDNVEEDSRSHAQILSAFKNRLKWDIRGKVADLEALLKMNNIKMEELKQFKEDLELKKNERITKASEAKERLSTLKLEAQELQRHHADYVAKLEEEQDAYLQKLNEESIELKRRYNALDIEVNDTHELLESKKKALEDQKEESTKLTETLKLIATSTASVEEDIRDTNSKLECADTSLADKENEIQKLESEIKDLQQPADTLQASVDEAHSDRDRLLNIIENMEKESANKARRPSKPSIAAPPSSSPSSTTTA